MLLPWPAPPVTLGVDLGGSKLLACAVDSAGRIHATVRQEIDRRTSPEEVVGRVAALCERLHDDGLPLSAIGVGVPGLVDHRRGLVLSSVMLDGWEKVDLGRRLAAATGLPATLDNDVNMAARCELGQRGLAVARGDRCLLYVAVGTEIGGALCLDGQLWRGAAGVAGEIGHLVADPQGRRCICGRRGCLNTVASGPAIEIAAGIAPGTLAEHWRRREPAVVEAVRAGARVLGRGLADVIHLLNPSLIVLGGGVAQLGEAYFEEVRSAIAAEAFAEAFATCRIEPSRVGYAAGAIGAAYLAATLDPHAQAQALLHLVDGP
jgi:glucokinase